MNLNALRYFIAVAETRSISRAAERLRVAQPTLSIALKRLEGELGQSLLERAPRRTDLSPFGKSFLARARAILSEYEAARAEARATRRGAERLRLGLLPTLPNRALGRLLAAYAAAHPEMSLELAEAPQNVLAERLLNGRLDLALTALTPDLDPSRTKAIFREPYLLAMPERHRLATRPRVAISELQGLSFVVRGDCEVLREADRAFARHGVKPNVAARTVQEERLAHLVLAGLGLAFVPESIGRRPGLALVEIAELPLSRRIGLAWRPGAARRKGSRVSPPSPRATIGRRQGWTSAWPISRPTQLNAVPRPAPRDGAAPAPPPPPSY